MALQVWLPLSINSNMINQYDDTIYVESDGSNWVRISHHNNPTSNGLFSSSDNFTLPLYKDANRWFNCQLLNNITKSSWELMVKQKTTSDATETKYRWIQYVNPYEANFSNTVATSVTKITSSGYSTVANAGGMYKINSDTYFCINNSTSGNWFGAIGSWGTYNTNQVPGYPNTSISTGYIDLYLRLDDKDNICRNLGTSGISFVTNGNIGYDVGKVTSYCMKTNWTTVDNTKANNVHSVTNLTPPSQYSISLWFKITTNSATTQHIYQYGGSDYSSDSSTSLGVGLCVNGTTLLLNRNSARANVMTGLSINKWYHAVVIDNNKVLSVYVDGVQKYTFTNTRPYATSNPLVIGSLHATSWYTFFGEVNDFRLYDHCLSVKEIKNLAKGLMLHYTLSRSGANLLKNTSTEKSWTYSGTSSSDSNYSQETITPASDSYYTMSFDAKSNRNSTSNFITYLYNNNSGRQCDSVKGYIDGQLVYTGSASDGACVMPTYTYYRHYVIVRHFNTNATALTKQNVFRISNSGSTALTMYVKNAKIELGDKSTPWIPNSTDSLYTSMGFNRNIEDDTSGYNNNGTRTNITTWNTDTARYLSSMMFNGSNSYIRCLDPIKSMTTEFSISVWVYLNNVSSTMCVWNGRTTAGASVALFVVNSNIYFDDSTRTTVSAGLSANKWTHIVATWKSGGNKIVYVNGVSKSSVSAGTLSKSNNYATIGLSSSADGTPSSNPFNGRISDFRIYATALSANDVKELYNVGASIDKNGNMHCYELVES